MRRRQIDSKPEAERHQRQDPECHPHQDRSGARCVPIGRSHRNGRCIGARSIAANGTDFIPAQPYQLFETRAKPGGRQCEIGDRAGGQ